MVAFTIIGEKNSCSKCNSGCFQQGEADPFIVGVADFKGGPLARTWLVGIPELLPKHDY